MPAPYQLEDRRHQRPKPRAPPRGRQTFTPQHLGTQTRPTSPWTSTEAGCPSSLDMGNDIVDQPAHGHATSEPTPGQHGAILGATSRPPPIASEGITSSSDNTTGDNRQMPTWGTMAGAKGSPQGAPWWGIGVLYRTTNHAIRVTQHKKMTRVQVCNKTRRGEHACIRALLPISIFFFPSLISANFVGLSHNSRLSFLRPRPLPHVAHLIILPPI